MRRSEAGDDATSKPPMLYAASVSLCEKINIEPSVPRTASKQRNRANAPSSSPEEYYRRNLILPFLDDIISEMNARLVTISLSIIIFNFTKNHWSHRSSAD